MGIVLPGLKGGYASRCNCVLVGVAPVCVPVGMCGLSRRIEWASWAMTELPFHARAGFYFVLGFAGSHVIEKLEVACRVFGDRWRSI